MSFWHLFSGRDRLLGAVVVLAASAACIRLGIWQLDQLTQRRAFNQEVLLAKGMAPLSLPAAEDLAGQEYRAVSAVGTYDFQDQIAIRNQFLNGEYGFHLITPLVFESNTAAGGPEAVLVDRGWIPAAGNGSPADWRKYDGPPAVRVNGVLRLPAEAPSFAGLAEPTPVQGNGRIDFWIFVDINGIRKQISYGLAPAYIQKNPDGDSLQPPVAVAPTLDLSEGPHLGYAIQWFGFATLFVVGYPFYLHRREGRRT